MTYYKAALILLATLHAAASTEQGRVYFTHIGETSHQASAVTIQIRVDIEEFHAAAKEVHASIGLMRAKIGRSRRMWQADKEEWLIDLDDLEKRAARVLGSVERIKESGQPFPEDLVKQPSKRFIGITIAILVTLAMTAYGIYTAVELKKLRDETDATREALMRTQDIFGDAWRLDQRAAGIANHTAHTVAAMRVSQLDSFYLRRIDDATVTLELYLHEVETIYNAALDGRLAHQAIARLDTNKVVQTLRENLRQKGQRPVVQRMSDILQLPISFALDESGLDLLVHIPTAADGSYLQMYRWVPLPIPIKGDFHALIKPDCTVLAVSDDDTRYRCFSDSELTECIRTGTYWNCLKSNVIQKIDTNKPVVARNGATCLLALFLQRYEDARRACRVDVVRAPDTVRQIASDEFVAYATAEHQGRIRCPGQPAKERNIFTATKISSVRLQHGCTAETDDFEFYAADDGRVRRLKIGYTIPQNTLNFTGHVPDEHVERLLTEAAKTAEDFNNFPIDKLHDMWKKEQDNSVPNPIALAHKALSATTVTVIIIIAVTVLCCWCRGREDTQNVRPATTATAPTIIMQQPLYEQYTHGIKELSNS